MRQDRTPGSGDGATSVDAIRAGSSTAFSGLVQLLLK